MQQPPAQDASRAKRDEARWLWQKQTPRRGRILHGPQQTRPGTGSPSIRSILDILHGPRRPGPGPASRAAPWAASTSEDGASPSRRGGIAAQPPPGPGPLPSRQVPGAKKQSQPRASSTAVCAPLPSHRCGPRDPGGGWSAAGGPGRLDDLPSSARRGSTLPEFLKGGGAFWCSCG